jgi:BirA family biotin operon repressor/biotin-[acetyl-CoA-carboxylase] ligase
MLYKRFLTGEIQALRNEWLLYSIIIGEKVNIFSDGGKETGIAETVDDDGALILLTPDGERKKIVAGDVSLRIQNPGVRKQKKEERKQNESSLS